MLLLFLLLILTKSLVHKDLRGLRNNRCVQKLILTVQKNLYLFLIYCPKMGSLQVCFVDCLLGFALLHRMFQTKYEFLYFFCEPL